MTVSPAFLRRFSPAQITPQNLKSWRRCWLDFWIFANSFYAQQFESQFLISNLIFLPDLELKF